MSNKVHLHRGVVSYFRAVSNSKATAQVAVISGPGVITNP